MPLCAPTNPFSAFLQASAISFSDIDFPASAKAAKATATSIEADELNPAPSGTSPFSVMVNEGAATPEWRRLHSTPAG